MKKTKIILSLLFLSGCQSLTNSVPGRISTTSTSYVFITPNIPTITSNNSSSINSSSTNNSSSTSSNISSNTNMGTISNTSSGSTVIGDIKIDNYHNLYSLNNDIEIVSNITIDELNNKINDLKNYHLNSNVYRYYENYLKGNNKILIESNVDKINELLSLQIRIEYKDGSYENEDAYIKDSKYYGHNHNSNGEDNLETNDLSLLGEFDFVIENLNAYYSNSMANPFVDVDIDNMNFGYDKNDNLIIQNDDYRLVISEGKFIYKILENDEFIIEYNTTNFEFPDFTEY